MGFILLLLLSLLLLLLLSLLLLSLLLWKGGREGRREERKEGGRERGKEGGRERRMGHEEPMNICLRLVLYLTLSYTLSINPLIN